MSRALGSRSRTFIVHSSSTYLWRFWLETLPDELWFDGAPVSDLMPSEYPSWTRLRAWMIDLVDDGFELYCTVTCLSIGGLACCTRTRGAACTDPRPLVTPQDNVEGGWQWFDWIVRLVRWVVHGMPSSSKFLRSSIHKPAQRTCIKTAVRYSSRKREDGKKNDLLMDEDVCHLCRCCIVHGDNPC